MDDETHISRQDSENVSINKALLVLKFYHPL